MNEQEISEQRLLSRPRRSRWRAVRLLRHARSNMRMMAAMRRHQGGSMLRDWRSSLIVAWGDSRR